LDPPADTSARSAVRAEIFFDPQNASPVQSGGSAVAPLSPYAVWPTAEQASIPQDGGVTWQLLAGAGFSLLTPFVDNNRAFGVFTVTKAGETIQSTDFGNPLAVAPRFWLGLAGPGGWGFRTSFWHFGDSDSLTASLDGTSRCTTFISSAAPMGLGVSTGTFLLAKGNTDVLSVSERLNLNAFDFEFTREIGLGRTFLLLSGGARYARIGQHYDADVYNTANNFARNAEDLQLHSAQRFIGGGPTLAMQGWYPLGRTRFSIYGTARGTLLFGDSHQAASVDEVVAVKGTLIAVTPASASASHVSAVPVGELEIGLQWTGMWRRFYPFLRTGVTAQTWFNALTASSIPTYLGNTGDPNTNLSFLGVSFQAGLSY
jgi:hypothetical protein